MASNPYSKMLDVEVVGGDQRTRLAEMLRANALNTPQGQMVGNWYVKPSWTQNLAHLANTAVGVFGGQAIDEENRKTMQEDYQKFMSGQSPQKVAAAVRAQGQPLTDEQAAREGIPMQTPAAGGMEGGEFKLMKTSGIQGMPSYGTMPQQAPVQQFDRYDPSQYSNPQFQRMVMQRNMQQAMAVPEYHGGVHEDAQGRQFIVSKTGESKYLTDASGNPVYSNKNINAWTRDPSGNIVPVSQVQQYEITKSRAGAPNVNVNTAMRPFLGELGKGAAENVLGAATQANSAQQTISNVGQIRAGLGNAILGPGADVRVGLKQLGQTLNVGGANDAEILSNTRNVMQGLARQELAAAGQMKGQGQITESERAILRKAESGNINELTSGELNTMLNAMERTAKARIATHERNLQLLQQDPNAANMVPFLQNPVQAAPTVPLQPTQQSVGAPRGNVRFRGYVGQPQQ